jgi:Tfp pilus assembly protein FimT
MKLPQKGMTLLELILVMIVIFTLATAVAPRFSDFFPGLQVRKTAGLIFALARKARSDGATTGVRQRLALDAGQKKFWLEVEAKPLKEPGKFTPLSGSWDAERIPDEVILESLDGAQQDSGRHYIEFRPDGTATEATLVIANDKGDRQTIRVVGTTGRVFIESPAEP